MGRTALIVGAGIGGLAAAISLRKAGCNVRIFEQARNPRELGFGVGLAPNAMAALSTLGVADVVMARGFAPVNALGEIRRTDGTVLKRAYFPPREALGGPFVMALRPALHGALLETVGAESIVLSSQATGCTHDAERVTLHLADGSRAEGDLLVGADGIWSTIRRELHPTESIPRSSGIVAVRGAVDGALPHLNGLAGIYYLGKGIEAFCLRASQAGIYWALSVSRRLLPPSVKDVAGVLKHILPVMDGTFRAVVCETEETRYDELVDRDPLPSWGRGAVTLLGDAAHPVLPQTGQGASQALVDAVTLGQVLTAEQNVGAALRSYESERRAKTAALVRQGRRTAQIMSTTNPLACSLRDIAVRLMPVASFIKVLVAINRRAGTKLTGESEDGPD